MPRATRQFLEIGRERTVDVMAPHVTHIGVHDHGFNNVSTYGNLLRLMNEGRIADERVGAPILRTRAEMFGRGAGGALVPDCAMAAGISIPSTDPIRCLSIRFARCARLAVSTGWAMC